MRKYLRSIARANMKRAGVQRMNDARYVRHHTSGAIVRVQSYFAANWRKWI